MSNRTQSVVHLNEQLLGMLGMLRSLLGEGVALSASLTPRLGAVPVDSSALHEVILHLAGIAHNSTPSGDSIIIETHNISLGSDDACAELGLAPGEHVCLAISATATGAAQEVIAQSFAVPSDCGMRLFLAPVYAFAKRSGGTAAIRRESGRGTTVSLYLPWAQETSVPDVEDSLDALRREHLRGTAMA